jgi:hypothetical protein
MMVRCCEMGVMWEEGIYEWMGVLRCGIDVVHVHVTAYSSRCRSKGLFI